MILKKQEKKTETFDSREKKTVHLLLSCKCLSFRKNTKEIQTSLFLLLEMKSLNHTEYPNEFKIVL